MVVSQLFFILGGHLGILTHIHSEHRKLHMSNACHTAAKHGHLHILKWFYSIGQSFGTSLCFMAAASGKLEVIKWARENNIA